MSKLNTNHFLQTVLLLWLFFMSYSIGLAQDARLIAKNIFPSVVMLEMRDDKNRPIALGSGFFVRPDVVVTNYHVIEGASDGFAKIVGETSIYHIEGVVGIDKAKDLALLKLTGVSGKPLILADISKIEVGQEVFALGNPKGLEGTISPGIISGSSLRQVENENLIQITAPISPGSSGGPVVNKRGEVIGVAVASLKDGQNLNFAVPSSYLALLLANSKSAVSLSSVTRSTREKPSSDSEPTLAEITAWITDKLLGRRMLYGRMNVSNERIVFDNCTMTSTVSMELGPYKDLFTHVTQSNKIMTAFFSGEENRVHFLYDDSDTVPFRQDSYEDGKLVKSVIQRDDGPALWVSDKELGVRVVKAFNQLAKLCKEETKKEPF